MAHFLQVTHNGREIEYDGYLMRYLEADASSLLLFQPGQSHKATLDISHGYSFMLPGEYKIRYNRPPTYFKEEDVITDGGYMNSDAMIIQSDPLEVENEYKRQASMAIVYQNRRRSFGVKTEGETVREEEERANYAKDKNITSSNNFDNEFKLEVQNAKSPRLEQFPDQRTRNYMVALHEAAYFYCEVAKNEVNTNNIFRTWIGEGNEFRRQDFRNLFKRMKDVMEKETITYQYGYYRCTDRTAGFAVKGSRRVKMCPVAFTYPQIAHGYSALNTVIHELTHAILSTDDITYGFKGAKNLAINKPEQVEKSASNLAYFTVFGQPINIGVDSATTHNSKTYLTKGPVYVRYSDTGAKTLDCEYPKLIYGNWGPPSKGKLRSGFSTMLRITGDNKIYITKGKEYWKFNAEGDNNPVGPQSIESGFSSNGLPTAFKNGFDSHFKLDGRYFATHGKRVIQYSDISSYFIAPGFPKNLDEYWQGLNDRFSRKFTAALTLRNGKFCAFSGHDHVCSSEKTGRKIDDYYPHQMRGHFGEYKCFNYVFSTPPPY